MKLSKLHIAVAVSSAFLIFYLPGPYAQCENEQAKIVTDESQTSAVNAGNQICPVSDDDIISGEAIMIEYKGKIYNLCCEACAKHFQKFPEKFAKKAEAK